MTKCNKCRYLYCDEITLEADTVLSTLYVAKKYIVPHLCRACVLFLETSLTARNACLLLSQSRLFEEPELMSRCWEVIDAQAQLALHSEGFTEIDMDTLKQILQRETLNCKEVFKPTKGNFSFFFQTLNLSFFFFKKSVIFQAALQWASKWTRTIAGPSWAIPCF